MGRRRSVRAKRDKEVRADGDSEPHLDDSGPRPENDDDSDDAPIAAAATDADQAKKPPKKRAAKPMKRSDDDDEPDNDADPAGNSPKRRSAKLKRSDDDDEEGDEPDDDADRANKSSKRRSAKPTKRSEPAESSADDEDDEFEVEQILDSKKIKGRVHFLIRWKGYQPESDTWEPESTLSCPDLIAKFKEKQVNGKSERGTKRKSVQKSGKAEKQKVGRPKKVLKTDFDYENADEEEEYEVEKILEVHFKKSGKKEFLIHWKGWTSKHDTWEPEENLTCPDLINNFLAKVSEKKNITPRDLRVAPSSTKRFTLASSDKGRRLSKRRNNSQRVRYDDAE